MGTLFFVRVDVTDLRLGIFTEHSKLTRIRTVWAYKNVLNLSWRIYPYKNYCKRDYPNSNNEKSPCGCYSHKDLVALKIKGIIVYKPRWH